MSSMKYIFCILVYNCVVNKCIAVINHLNDTEYARMPPLFALDNYELCLQQAGGVYCMSEYSLHEGSNKKLMSMIKGYSEHMNKHYNHSDIQRGVCLQKSCHEFLSTRNLRDVVDVSDVLEECVNESMWNEYGLEAALKLVYYCDRNGDVNHYDIGDWTVVALFAVIVILNVLGTCYNITLKKNKQCSMGNKFLLSFSLSKNWDFLTNSEPADVRIDRLKGLHGYRTIIIFLMVFAHVIWIDSMGFTANAHDFEKGYDNIIFQTLCNGMMITQAFLVLSGFLFAYNMMIRSEKQPFSWKMYPRLLLLRWCRLTPAYAVVLAFTTTWLRHIGSGPLWRLWVTESVVGDCRRYWWLHLLYANNYVPDDKFCMIQSWYLGAEMQAFAICLLVFLLTPSRARVLVLSVVMAVGSIALALQTWLLDLDGVIIMRPEFHRKKINATFDIHVLGHNCLVAYAVGMATACTMYQLQQKGVDKKKSKILSTLSWCVFPAMLCLFLVGKGFYVDGPRAHLALRVVWAAGHRLLISGVVAFAILSLVMRFSESNCAVFEWSGWVVPGRLSYCVYLVHLIFISILMGNRAYLTQVSIYNIVIVHLGVVSISLLAAVPLYLMVEAPASSLVKIFTTTK